MEKDFVIEIVVMARWLMECRLGHSLKSFRKSWRDERGFLTCYHVTQV